jgi:hypothetical protein
MAAAIRPRWPALTGCAEPAGTTGPVRKRRSARPRPGRAAARRRPAVPAAGRLSLLLEHQPVHGPPGHLVQRVPGVEQQAVRGPDRRPGSGGNPGGGDGADRVHVPQAAFGLLEIGFEQEGKLTAALGALTVHGLEFGQWVLAAARQSAGTPSRSWVVNSASPATCRAGSSPRATRRSARATARASSGVPTAWSSRVPESHTGYQIRSASAEMSGRPSCSSTRSRSLPGSSSRRAYPPAATTATLGSAPSSKASQRSVPATRRDRSAANPVSCLRRRPPGRLAVRTPPGRAHRCVPAPPRPPGRTRPFRPRSGRSVPP